MSRLTFLLGTIAASMLCAIVLAGSAGADYHKIQYDLTGSTSEVGIYDPAGTGGPYPGTNPNPGTFPGTPAFSFPPNPVTGNFTAAFGGPNATAAPVSGRLLDGLTNADQTIDVTPIFKVTGMAVGDLHAAPYPVGSLGASSFTPAVVPDSSTTGYLHCTSGSCALGGFTLSVPIPLTPPPTVPGPFPLTLPTWNFTAAINVPIAGMATSWVAPPITQVIYNPAPTTATPSPVITQTQVIITKYQGQEISRVHQVPEPGFLSLLLPGVAGLGLMGWRHRR